MEPFLLSAEEKEKGEEESSVEARRRTVVQNLADAEAARRAELNQRRIQVDEQKDPKESLHLFLSQFQEKCSSVEKTLNGVLQERSGSSSASDAFQTISEKIYELSNSVSDSAYFLPAYHLKTCQATIDKLKSELSNMKSIIAPKKKFSFSSRPRKPPPRQQEQQSKQGNDPVPEEDRRSTGLISSTKLSFSNKQRETLVQRNISGEDFSLDKLSNCKVFLLGRISALYINSLKNCEVFTGAISGAAYIDSVEESVMVLASHQIRIHNTTNTDFYLRTRSNPIIEYCHGVRFGPYIFNYKELDGDLESCELRQENELWRDVNDFRWLKAIPSPNWSLIPTEERRQVCSPHST